MKISPVGTGAPGINLGAVSTSGSDPGRLAAAKAIAEGRQPVREESVDFNDPQAARMSQSVRSLKMRTNVSPDRHLIPTGEVENNTIDNTDGQSAAPEEQTEGSEDTKPLSPQFAALARQRRALQLKERELAAKERALAERSPVTDGGSNALERLKSDPLGVLQEAGVTYEQLTESILNGDASNPAAARIRELEAKIESLEKGIDTKLSERDSQAERQVLAEMSREANRLIFEEGDKYQLVREANKQSDVIDLIHRTWKESGEVLEVEEALELVEDYLVKEQLKFAKLSKIQGLLTPAQEAQLQQQAQRPQGIRTLTNRDGARPQISRRERALAAFYGTLKK